MNVERALISKAISTGRIDFALAQGVRSEHFLDDDCREVFEWLVEHVRRYRDAPSMEAVEMRFPNWEQHHHSDSIQFLIDRFIVTIKRREAQNLVIELAKAADDPQQSENIDMLFMEASRKLATIVPTSRVERFSNMEERVERYRKERGEKKQIGIPFGFPTLDAKTGGLQPHEFVAVAGFSGMGKSTLLLRFLLSIYENGYTPLLISLEMEARMILRRLDSMAANLDYNSMKHLRLEDREIEDWEQKAEEVREGVKDITIIDDIRGCTPDHVYGEAIRHKPDVILIDYVSLMKSSRPSRYSNRWESLTEITQDLKQNSRTLKVPIIAAAQTNRAGAIEGAELSNVGGSISITQDPDIVIGLFATDEMKDNNLIEIRLNKNRDGALDRFRAIWDHDKMIFRQQLLSDVMPSRRDGN